MTQAGGVGGIVTRGGGAGQSSRRGAATSLEAS